MNNLNSKFTNNDLICITDVDGTFVDSKQILLKMQATALSKIGKTSIEEELEYIKNFSLEDALVKYNITLNDFFKNHYKTFDPFKAAKEKNLYAFDDALEFSNYKIPLVAISNSSKRATKNKFKALGIETFFLGIHAEFVKEKSKPQLYLGKQAISNLKSKGVYSKNKTLIHIGDQEYDVLFGKNLRQIHPKIINVLINRDNSYKGSAKPDLEIASFKDLERYL